MGIFDDKTITQKILILLGIVVFFGVLGITGIINSISQVYSTYQNIQQHMRLIITLKYTFAALPLGILALIIFTSIFYYMIRNKNAFQQVWLVYISVVFIAFAFIFEIVGSIYFSYLLDKKGYSYCFVMSNHSIHNYVSDHKYCKSGYTLEQLEEMETHS